MSPFHLFLRLVRELWFSLDTASALKHGGTVSDAARRHTRRAATPERHPAS